LNYEPIPVKPFVHHTFSHRIPTEEVDKNQST